MLKFIQGAGRIRPDKIGVAELHLRVIENIFISLLSKNFRGAGRICPPEAGC